MSVQGQLLEMVDDTHLSVGTFVDLHLLDVASGIATAVVDESDGLDAGQAMFQPVRVADDRLIVPTAAGDVFEVAGGELAPTPRAGRVGLGGAAALMPTGTLLISGDAGFSEHAIDGGGILRSVLPGTDWATEVWSARDGQAMAVVHRRPGNGPASFDRVQEWACDLGGRDCAITDDRAATAADDDVMTIWWTDPNADRRLTHDDGMLEVFDTDGTSLGRVPAPAGTTVFVPDKPDWVAILELSTRNLTVRSLPDGALLADLDIDGIFRWLVGSPDGSVLMLTDPYQSNVQVIDTRTWTAVPTASETIGESVWVAFDRTGERLVTVASGAVTLRDGVSYEPIREFGGDGGGIAWTAFSDDGRLLLVTINRSTQLWDAETGRPIGQPSTLEWDGTYPVPGRTPLIVDVDPEQGVIIHRYEVESWADLACGAAGRNMTPEEWEIYGPSDRPYHATCPQWP